MNLERQFHQIAPYTIYLSEDNIQLVNRYLSEKGWLRKSETLIDLKKAGEGNMNCVLRASTNMRTFIMKQSRPWVEKYPQIKAPIERVKVEAEFMLIAGQSVSLSLFIPLIRHFDIDNYLIIMDDLGEASDCSDLYQDQSLTTKELGELINFLNELHSQKPKEFPDNLAMKKLNHEHIFVIPFEEENGLDLDSIQPGLSKLANSIIYNSKLKKEVKKMGLEYLANGTTLLHGDYYPGSFLRTETGLKVIDAEFSFLGFPEFDWAILLAHLKMSRQPAEIIQNLTESAAAIPALNLKKIRAYAGVEILRRFFGVAQLPLTLSLTQKEKQTQMAMDWILSYD